MTASTAGVDFGTSTTMVAVDGMVLPIGAGAMPRWIPSVVAYDHAGTLVVGHYADGAAGAIRSLKRAITLQQKVVRAMSPHGLADVPVDDLMVALLRTAVGQAVAQGFSPATHRIRLGCPAMWNGQQRRRLVDIAQRADLPVSLDNLVDEPVAAGIAWLAAAPLGLASQRIVVFDMGGGTLDIAVMEARGLRRRDVAVLAALGIPEAGDALDDAIAADLTRIVGVDINAMSNPISARAEIALAARALKVALTTDHDGVWTLSRQHFGGREVWYSRDQLNAVFEQQMDRAEMTLVSALRAARLAEVKPASSHAIARVPVGELLAGVDVVVLSGGMVHVPYVKERLLALFGAGSTDIVFAYPPTGARLFQQPELAVVIGLGDADRFGRINMYRPAFDILLEWDSRREYRTVYHAFTPLVEPWQIARGGHDLRFVRTGLELDLPRAGHGELRIVSHTGDSLRATLGNRSLDGFPVALSDQKFEFSLYPNGRIRLIDAIGTHEGLLPDWRSS